MRLKAIEQLREWRDAAVAVGKKTPTANAIIHDADKAMEAWRKRGQAMRRLMDEKEKMRIERNWLRARYSEQKKRLGWYEPS